MTPRPLLLATVLLGLLAGCGRGSDGDGRQITRMPHGLAGVYAGDFPCSNCAAIAATLWLRPDGRFFLRQSFVGDDERADGSAYALGRWRWDENDALIILAGAGPERRFSRLDEQRLKMHTASKTEHVLSRDAFAPPFGDLVRLDGESAIIDGNAVFTECLTGLQFPVAKNGGFTALRRQHRLLNARGKVALTAIDARITEGAAGDATAELLVIERFIDLRPGVGC